MEDPNKSEQSNEERVVPTGLWTFYPSLPGIAMPGFHIPQLRGWISDRGVVYRSTQRFIRSTERFVVTETLLLCAGCYRVS
jgi:hypothetical protein